MVRLLVIDDDEELCEELVLVLKAEGYKVDVALDGLKGLQLMQSQSFNVIILDLKLPGINGFEVLKKIRKNDGTPKILVLSGRPLGEPLLLENGIPVEEEEKILRLADCVINKPFVVEDLIHKIKELSLSKVEKSQ